MSLATQVAAELPYLRRYARALSGSQIAGDNYVRAVLEAALADPQLKADLEGGRVPLYRAFNRLWASAQAPRETETVGAGAGFADEVEDRLQKVTPLNRQALLLTTLEDFSPDEAGAVLGRTAEEIEALVTQAIAEIEAENSASVLIIEDEPLISMQLEDLVRSLGHDICGTAATRSQAEAIVAQTMPSLVLADIQLADGSSGLDAVEDILTRGEVPVIFITAYPERLLTGCCNEPTYLVTKPFREATVRAAISQALFFSANRA